MEENSASIPAMWKDQSNAQKMVAGRSSSRNVTHRHEGRATEHDQQWEEEEEDRTPAEAPPEGLGHQGKEEKETLSRLLGRECSRSLTPQDRDKASGWRCF